MRFKSILLALLVSAMLIAPVVAFSEGNNEVGDYVSLAAPKGPNAGIAPGHYGLISSYADNYFSSSASTSPVPNIFRMFYVPQQLAEFEWIIDVRQPKGTHPAFTPYCSRHFTNAINIPFQFIAKPSNLAQLPTDGSRILVVCYSGVSSAEVAAFLNLLGYNAFFLMGGTSNPSFVGLLTDSDGESCNCPDGTSWNGWECAD
jgi:rhodanese-related sulfurtransferase